MKQNNYSRKTPSGLVSRSGPRHAVITAHVPLYFDKHEESMCNFPKVRIINMLISETQFPSEVSSTRRARISMYDNHSVARG